MSPQKKRSYSFFGFIEADFRVIVFSGQPSAADQTSAYLIPTLNAVACRTNTNHKQILVIIAAACSFWKYRKNINNQVYFVINAIKNSCFKSRHKLQ